MLAPCSLPIHLHNLFTCSLNSPNPPTGAEKLIKFIFTHLASSSSNISTCSAYIADDFMPSKNKIIFFFFGSIFICLRGASAINAKYKKVAFARS